MNMTSDQSEENLSRRIWRQLPALFFLLLLIIIAVVSVKIKSESDRVEAEKLAALHRERPPANVVTLNVTPRPIADRLNLPAQVEPWVELMVLAEVSGKVLEVFVEEGDLVDQGDMIVRLDSRDYENELASVRADYELARINLKRTRELFEEKLITKAQFDSDLARVERLEAGLKNAELRLERSSIRAPVSGIINRMDAEKGLFLNVQDPVAVILDISRVKVSVGIPESDVDQVRKLSHFDMTIDALDGKTVRGRKFFLSKNPEDFAHLYTLDIEVVNPGGQILPGMFADVRIVKKKVENAITVPLYSVISRENKKIVFIAKEGKAHVRMVETGILEKWKVQITKGLSEGEHVIVVGHRNVSEGQDVEVVRTVSDPEELFK